MNYDDVTKLLASNKHILVSVLIVFIGKLSFVASTFFYSRYLTVSEFGVVNVFMSWATLLVPLLFFNMYAGFGRILYTGKFSLQIQVDSTVLAFIFIGAVEIAFFYLFSWKSSLSGLPEYAVLLLFPVIAGLLIEFLIIQYYVFTGNSTTLLGIVGLKVLTSLVTTIYGLSVMYSNLYLAVFYGEIAGSFVLLVIFVIKFKPLSGLAVSFGYLKSSAAYSLPLIFYGLSLTILSQSDRIMISTLVGIESAGLYSFAYNIGSMISILSVGIFNAVNPKFFNDMENNRYVNISQDAMLILYFHVLIVLVLILFGPLLMTLIVADKYVDSMWLLGGVGISCLMLVYFQLWVRILAFHHKTVYIAIPALLGSGVNVLLNYILIPIMGYEVAIFTTFIGYFVMNILVVCFVRRLGFNFGASLVKTIKITLVLALIYLATRYTLEDVRYHLILSFLVCLFVWKYYSRQLKDIVTIILGRKVGENEF